MTAQYRVERGVVDVCAGFEHVVDQRRVDAMGPGFGGRRTSHLRRYHLGEIVPADAMPLAEFLRLVELGVLVVVT